MNVVVDTNVLVSSFLKPHSHPARILRLVVQEEIQLVISEAILDEYAAVLSRAKFDLDQEAVRVILEFIRSKGIMSPSLPRRPRLPDEGDEKFLEAALSARADFLITGNKKHFPRKACRNQKVVNPGEFFRLLLE